MTSSNTCNKSVTRYFQKYFQSCALYKSGPQKQSFTRVKSGFKVFVLFLCNDKFCQSRFFVLLSNKEGMGPMKIISIFIRHSSMSQQQWNSTELSLNYSLKHCLNRYLKHSLKPICCCVMLNDSNKETGGRIKNET